MNASEWKDREREILTLLADGLSDRAIAARLSISHDTVRWYNKHIYDRLGVSSRTQAVHRATALGLLAVPLPAGTAKPPVRGPIRYVENDGVSLACQAIGDGPVDLLFIHGFLSHLEVAWENPEFTAFFDALGRAARVILFDKRGVGLSDRVQGAPSLEQTMDDAVRILDAFGSKRAYVFGTSEGGAAAVLLASMRPQRVRGLILCGATPMVARDSAEPDWAVPRADFEQRAAAMIATWGQPWAVERFAPSRIHDETFREWWSRILRAASSPASVRAVLENASRVDIRRLLPEVRTRTLVIHRTDDAVVKVGAGRHLAREMPNARLAELPGRDHIYFVDGEPVARATIRFLQEPDALDPVDTRIAILLCVAEPGGRISPDTRGALDACQARHLQPARQSWLALFDGPHQAAQAARRLRELGRGRAAGMALHVGACAVGDGRPAGMAAELAQRLAGAAQRGEILVSETLRDILAGSGLRLADWSLSAGSSGTPIAASRLAD